MEHKRYFLYSCKKGVVYGDGYEVLPIEDFMKAEKLLTPFVASSMDAVHDVRSTIENGFGVSDVDILVTDTVQCPLFNRYIRERVSLSEYARGQYDKGGNCFMDLFEVIAREHSKTYDYDSGAFISYMAETYGKDAASDMRDKRFIFVVSVRYDGTREAIPAIKHENYCIPINILMNEFRDHVMCKVHRQLSGTDTYSIDRLSLQ